MTIDEYKDLMLEDEINIGCYVEEDDLPEDLDEMKEFIETHGNSDFMCYYEDYTKMV